MSLSLNTQKGYKDVLCGEGTTSWSCQYESRGVKLDELLVCTDLLYGKRALSTMCAQVLEEHGVTAEQLG